MTWKSTGTGPIPRMRPEPGAANANRSLPSGPWTLQPAPRAQPTTMEIPVLSGATAALHRQKVAGLREQMRHDLRGGHHLEAEALLRERIKASKVELTEERIITLAESLRDVDRARAERERCEAEEAEGDAPSDDVPADHAEAAAAR